MPEIDPDGLVLRPARPGDAAFLASLYKSTRDDLGSIGADRDFIETLIEMQHTAQTVGHGDSSPDAMTFVIERLGCAIGRVAVTFGREEVHIVDLAFIPEARGRGHGSAVMRAMQAAAARVCAPVTLTVMRHRPVDIRRWSALGFRVAAQTGVFLLMAWHPDPGDGARRR